VGDAHTAVRFSKKVSFGHTTDNLSRRTRFIDSSFVGHAVVFVGKIIHLDIEVRTGRIGYCSREQDWIERLLHNKLPSLPACLLVLPQSLQQSDRHGFF
jgi:hypothetical protein